MLVRVNQLEVRDRIGSIVPWFCLFLGALYVRILCFTGLIASDDLSYARYARQIANGVYHIAPRHYALRFGVLLPVAAVYSLFGVHEWTTVAVPILCSSVACVFAARVAEQLGDRESAWVVGALTMTFPLSVRYASILVPEPIMQAAVLGGAVLFLSARRTPSVLTGVAAGACFGVGYLAKEPVAFVAMAFFIFALAVKERRLAAQFGLGVAVVLGAEFCWAASQSGDPFYRLHAMGSHNVSPMAIQANSNLEYRLWSAYPQLMLRPGFAFGLHSLFGLTLAGIQLVMVVARRERRSQAVLLLVLWMALPFLYLNFGSSSLRFYWALPVAARYVDLIYPPMFILAAMTLVQWARSGAAARRLCVFTVLIVCAVGVYDAERTRMSEYRASEVSLLRSILSRADAQGGQICRVTGPKARMWTNVVSILAPDRLGCTHPPLLIVLPDSENMPRSVALEPRLSK